MDSRRFDNFVRAMAAEAPRRRVLRGLLGTAAGALLARGRIGGAAAQDGTLQRGAACTSTAQCSQVGGAVVCADNGYADDGALNCCRNAGGACTDVTYSADCCSGLYCRGGVCTDLSVTGELPPGSYCTATSECSQASGPAICADNGIASDGALNCCFGEGVACSGNHALCCGGLFCVDGLCAPAPFGDLQAGDICTATIECSQAGGPTVCADNGLSGDGELNCCRLEVSSCASDAECCAGLVCGDNFMADDGPLTCCAPAGGACGSDAACCGYSFCVEGICQPG